METSICRCCASEGAFKDVKSTYHWMGEEEIYADMLKECFDINLFQPEGAEDSGICEVCITQLRNAVNFKKQVLHTEEQFKKQLQSGKMFKPSIVKVEVPMEHHDSDDDDHASAEDGYSEPDFEIPIKIEDTEETEKRPKSKKRAAPVKKSTSTRAKKAKIEEGEPSTKHENDRKPRKTIIMLGSDKKQGKRKTIIEITPRRPVVLVRSLNIRRKTELGKHQDNIRTILHNSNATPIGRYGGIGYACCFCTEQFEFPEQLKNHTIEQHENSISIFMENQTLPKYIVKLDITNLKCRLCADDITNLNEFIAHLKQKHEKSFHDNIKSHILPFRFGGDLIKCVECNKEYNNFKVLLEHMNSHYGNYICDVCENGFVNKRILQAHAYRHKTGIYNCTYCSKVFDAKIKLKDHQRVVHKYMKKRSKCGYCGERFNDYTQKNNHEVKVHGAKPVVLKCQACDKVFNNQRSLNMHVKSYHLMQRLIPK